MQYITGQHALNIPCPLLTCGDWHQSAIQWKYPLFRNSKKPDLRLQVRHGIMALEIFPKKVLII